MGSITLLDQAIFALAVASLREGRHPCAARLQTIISICSMAS
jgi:hypothetical protein